MIVRITDDLIIDHTEILQAKRGTHRGGAEPKLDIVYRSLSGNSRETAVVFGQESCDRIFAALAAQAR